MIFDPEQPNIVSILSGLNSFAKYEASEFSTDKAYREFVWNSLNFLGSCNPIETHTLLYEPGILPATEIDIDIQRIGCPDIFTKMGLDKIGLCWIDTPNYIKKYGISYFSEHSEIFSKPVLCDPNYGLAIFKHADKWIHYSFALDWIQKLPEEAQFVYIENPSRILDVGVEAAAIFWSDIVDEKGRKDLKQRIVPEVCIESIEQLREVAASLASSLKATNGASQLWFRGQTCEYLMPDRSELVANGYLPYANVRDPSLITSLYREADIIGGPREKYRKFLIDVMSWDSAAETIFGPSWIDVPYGEEMSGDDLSLGLEFSSNTSYLDADGKVLGGRTRHHTKNKSFWQRSLLLQHYGCPTPFLDVTSSIDTAHWFATHKFLGAENSSLFKPYEWDIGDPKKWPIIYCFLVCPSTQPIIDSKRLNTSAVISERAKRQDCGLLSGGGLLARNYAARFVGCKLKLHPKLIKGSQIDVEELFPSVDNDPVYKELTKLKSVGPKNMFPLYGI